MRNQKGFTLIELLIVIGILGALAAIALPRYGNAVGKARHKACLANIAAINTALELYNVSEGAYPVTATVCKDSVLLDTDYFPDGEPLCEYVLDGLDQNGYADAYDTALYRIIYTTKHSKTFGTYHTE